MLKYLILLAIFLSGCTHQPANNAVTSARIDFTSEEQKILYLSKDIIKNTYFATFISVDAHGQPRARVMEPFPPESNFDIWFATNPNSRKVRQLKNNSKVTVHYFDKANLGYVSLMGNAYLVNDPEIKASIWKEGWEKFYPDRDKDYLLIQFVPNTLELISAVNNYPGDSVTWKPHLVTLQK